MRVVISTMEAATKIGYHTYLREGIHSPVMIGPTKSTPPAAERFLKMKITMIEKEHIGSSEDALKRF